MQKVGTVMSWFYNLRIQVRLMAGFALVLALVGLVASIGVTRLAGIENDNASLYRHNTLGVQYILQTNANMIASAREELRAAIEKDPTLRAGWIKQSRDELATAAKSLESYKVTFASKSDEQEWTNVKAMVEKVSTGREQALELLEASDDDGAAAARKALGGDIASMNKVLNDLGVANTDRAKAATDSAAADASSGRAVLISGALLALLFGLGVAYLIARNVKQGVAALVDRLDSITKYCVTHLQDGIKAVEQGDLTVDAQPVTPKIAKPHKDEIGRAGSTINLMLDKLVDTMASYNSMRHGLSEIVGGVRQNADSVLSASGSLRESSDQMAAATGQIAKAINEVTLSAISLAQLSEESAQEVERVAAGSQELAATAAANAETAGQSKSEAVYMSERIEMVAAASSEVAAAAEQSGNAAVQGQRAVREAVESMESIASAVERAQETVDELGGYSEQIGDIVQTISGIAAQTNLLALNAAIEAAAAGDQGRGFAVVADNVRRLAEQSSQSAKEIKALVGKVQIGTKQAVEAMDAGVQDVRRGRQITTEAGDALASIIESVEHSATQMQQIAVDVQGLQDGAASIAKSAESLAMTAEQSAAATIEMATSTSKVTDTILQVSSTSEETSASAEEVSASTEELSAQSEELAATANEMQSLAESLNQATNRFKLADTLIDARDRFGPPAAPANEALPADPATEGIAELKLAA